MLPPANIPFIIPGAGGPGNNPAPNIPGLNGNSPGTNTTTLSAAPSAPPFVLPSFPASTITTTTTQTWCNAQTSGLGPSQQGNCSGASSNSSTCPQPGNASPQSALSGNYLGTITFADNSVSCSTVTLNQNGNTLSGSDREINSVTTITYTLTGSISGSTLTFQGSNSQGGNAKFTGCVLYSGTVNQTAITGTVQAGSSCPAYGPGNFSWGKQ